MSEKITTSEKRTIESVVASFGLPSKVAKEIIEKKTDEIPRNRRHIQHFDSRGNQTFPNLNFDDCIRTCRALGFSVASEHELEEQLRKGLRLPNGARMVDYYGNDETAPRHHESE